LNLNFAELPAEVGVFLRIIIIIVVFAVINKLGTRLIDTVLDPDRVSGGLSDRRVNTLRGLARSMLKYSIYFIGGVMVLEELGVPTTSILAGAGILGLAVGFGAQNLVRDVITGFFILFEDQFAVGDYITVSGVTGYVDEMGLRVTKIRSWTGELHTIPNGKIEQVTNYARTGSGVLFEVTVAYDEDLDQVISVINDTCHKMAHEIPDPVIEEPKALGVVDLSDKGATIQIFGLVKPMEHWGYTRELRKRLKAEFERVGIEISYPHHVLIKKQGRGQSRDEV
jgi:small-conductance mechanosensitive channel